MKEDYKILEKRAIYLRRRHGKSYGEIKKALGISKSTISLWLRDIPLSEEHRKRLYTKQIEILSRGPQSQRERRKREIELILKEAEREIPLPLSFEAYRLAGAMLYWAEGRKTNGFGVTNSDPHLILFITKWFERIFKISPGSLKAWLNIYPQQNDLELKRFWSQLTGIPLENFGKSFVKPLNRGYKKNNLYYGTISVRVPKGTDMRYRVFGWVKAGLKDIVADIELVEKEWRSLKEIPRPINIS